MRAGDVAHGVLISALLLGAAIYSDHVAAADPVECVDAAGYSFTFGPGSSGYLPGCGVGDGTAVTEPGPTGGLPTETVPSPADTWEASSQAEQDAVTEFLRWHQVWRWEQTGLIDCESGGDWHINTGNGYFGGAQMGMPFWRHFQGTDFAPRPDLAEPWQQAAVLDRFVDSGGSFRQAFPACARRLGL